MSFFWTHDDKRLSQVPEVEENRDKGGEGLVWGFFFWNLCLNFLTICCQAVFTGIHGTSIHSLIIESF